MYLKCTNCMHFSASLSWETERHMFDSYNNQHDIMKQLAASEHQLGLGRRLERQEIADTLSDYTPHMNRPPSWLSNRSQIAASSSN